MLSKERGSSRPPYPSGRCRGRGMQQLRPPGSDESPLRPHVSGSRVRCAVAVRSSAACPGLAHAEHGRPQRSVLVHQSTNPNQRRVQVCAKRPLRTLEWLEPFGQLPLGQAGAGLGLGQIGARAIDGCSLRGETCRLDLGASGVAGGFYQLQLCPPLLIELNHGGDEIHIRTAPALRFAHDVGVTASLGSKQDDVEHLCG
eukprot:scaffold2109_cov123-Isochrysis_galbana.AAC.20